jgi:hypothetical protein
MSDKEWVGFKDVLETMEVPPCPCEACTKERVVGTTKSVLDRAREKLPDAHRYLLDAWKACHPGQDVGNPVDPHEMAKLALQLTLLER